MSLNYPNEKIEEALRDAGCDESCIREFMESCKNGNEAEKNRLLAEYRKGILDNIHKIQRQLYCLDYLIYKINKSK